MSRIISTKGFILESKTNLDASSITDMRDKIEQCSKFILLRNKMVQDDIYCLFNVDISSHLSDEEDGLYVSWLIYKSARITDDESLNQFMIKFVLDNDKEGISKAIREYSNDVKNIIDEEWEEFESFYPVNIAWAIKDN